MFNFNISGGWLHFITRLRAYLPSKMEYQADSEAADVTEAVADLNALLQKLRDSGAMENE